MEDEYHNWSEIGKPGKKPDVQQEFNDISGKLVNLRELKKKIEMNRKESLTLAERVTYAPFRLAIIATELREILKDGGLANFYNDAATGEQYASVEAIREIDNAVQAHNPRLFAAVPSKIRAKIKAADEKAVNEVLDYSADYKKGILKLKPIM